MNTNLVAADQRHPSATEGPPSRRARIGCVVVAIGLLAVICPAGVGLVALALSFLTDVPDRCFLIPLLPFLLLLVKWIVDAAASSRAKLPNFALATSVGVALAAIPLGVSMSEVVEPLLDFNHPHPPDHDAFAKSLLLAEALLLSGLAVLMLPQRAWVRVAPALRWLVPVAWLAVAALTVVAAARASTRTGVTQHRYWLTHLKLAEPGIPEKPATPYVPPEIPFAGLRGYGQPPALFGPGTKGERRHALGPLSIVQDCREAGCWIRIEDDGGAPAPSEPTEKEAVLQAWGERLQLLWEEHAHVVYVRGPCETPDPFHVPDCDQIDKEFRHTTGGWRLFDHDAAAVRSRTSAPGSWIFSAASGLLITVALGFARRRAARSGPVLDTAVEGVLDAGGVIAFHDRPPARLDSRTGLPDGPVVVLGNPSAGSAPFRDMPIVSTTQVLPGSLADHKAERTLALLRYDARILAVLAITAAALVGGAAAGLVA